MRWAASDNGERLLHTEASAIMIAVNVVELAHNT